MLLCIFVVIVGCLLSSQLESRLEFLLGEVANMPPSFVATSEREKDKRRRDQKRLEQQTLQLKLQEERNRRAIERAMQVLRNSLFEIVCSLKTN